MNLSNKKSIIQLLRDKSGLTITKFAKKHHVARQSVYEAIGGNGARRVRVEIAWAVGIPPSMLWGDNHRTKNVVDDLHYMGVNHD